MKYLNSRIASLTMVAAAAVLWVAPASAQSTKVRVDIPFEFVAGNSVLPAGQYYVTLDGFPRVLLQGTNEKNGHMVALSGKSETRPASGAAGAKLQFSRYAGTVFLTGVWAPGHEDGKVVARSARLTEAMNAAGGEGGPTVMDLNSSLK